MNELRKKRYESFDQEPLPADEEPEEIYLDQKLYLPPYYFEFQPGIDFKLPKLLKQLPREFDTSYEIRVKNYLSCLNED